MKIIWTQDRTLADHTPVIAGETAEVSEQEAATHIRNGVARPVTEPKKAKEVIGHE